MLSEELEGRGRERGAGQEIDDRPKNLYINKIYHWIEGSAIAEN